MFSEFGIISFIIIVISVILCKLCWSLLARWWIASAFRNRALVCSPPIGIGLQIPSIRSTWGCPHEFNIASRGCATTRTNLPNAMRKVIECGCLRQVTVWNPSRFTMMAQLHAMTHDETTITLGAPSGSDCSIYSLISLKHHCNMMHSRTPKAEQMNLKCLNCLVPRNAISLFFRLD